MGWSFKLVVHYLWRQVRRRFSQLAIVVYVYVFQILIIIFEKRPIDHLISENYEANLSFL